MPKKFTFHLIFQSGKVFQGTQLKKLVAAKLVCFSSKKSHGVIVTEAIFFQNVNVGILKGDIAQAWSPSLQWRRQLFS